ncbi:nicotinate-nucleotide pyrophosphorylase [Thermodesulfatator indicus DSM 15286]|uniref:Probable nicotinate-nucleotide pyrophosphorylase [carboxylating] n=1 Tax=Thermodesulfatator indicus (strain DSM 15286 / JCM 11887 / CIR29812) TaxID=667014 RepID=F8ABW8_THEID|nr:carboxylating nicotinate-nucleotide diphosphorylase [Thermodesulfatator indicus]AEH45660.1 nicotinate-nucleotide pyrophosphorylase [Thermodesulfatator indicus DSM 15286]
MFPIPPHPLLYRDFVKKALEEDLGHGDVTTDTLISPEEKGKGLIRAKEDLIICGIPIARIVFKEIDPDLAFIPLKRDAEKIKRGEVVAEVCGKITSILKGERVCLNFLQHLSGVATYTYKFVEKIKGLPVKIVDTRKTLPGFRVLEKYAVLCGGGRNHRFGLSDGVLIKDNHIKACGSVKKAIKRAKEYLPHVYLIEIEVSNLEELKEAIEAGAHALLLDNMDVKILKEAVALAKSLNPYILLEASGGINLENVRQIAETGVDIISIGKLTHSAPAVDLNLKIVEVFS